MRSLLALATFLAASSFAAAAFAQECDGTPDGQTDPANTCRLCEAGAWRFLPEYTVCEPSELRCFDGPDGDGIYRNQCVPAGTDETTCAEVFKTTCPNGYVCAEDGTCGTECLTSDDCIDGYECNANACQRKSSDPDAGMPDAGGPDAGTPDGGNQTSESDMGVTPDFGGGGADSGTSGGFEPDDGLVVDESGCSCATGGPLGADGSIALLLLGLLGVRSRKRNR